MAVLAQDPEGLDTAGGGSRGISGDCGQRNGRRLFRASVSERLPGEMGVGGHLGTQAGDEVSGRKLGVIRHHLRNETLRLDAPDTTGLFITVRVIAGNFVMADNLVIPVDDVEAAVWTHRHRDGAEERVVAADEVRELFESIARTLTMLADRVDLRSDRVGDIHHAVVALGPDADIGER